MERQDLSDPWSIPETALVRELHDRLHADKAAVVATIVDVKGSAYRRPGAKMMVTPDNQGFGAVTAGCLESPVVDIATDVLADDRPRTETFDLMDNDEWGLGLGCNGIIDVLFEPLNVSLEPALVALAEREPVTVLTAVASEDSAVVVGDRTVFDVNENVVQFNGRQQLPASVVDEAVEATKTVRDEGKAAPVEVSTDYGAVTVFVDRLEPAPRLVLFGNQNDIHPVSRFARRVGFEVVVASPRGADSGENFPHAHEVVTTHPTELAAEIDDRTYVVLMSHNFLDDRLAMETLQTETDVPYIGLMGPRDRFERMLKELV